MTVNYGQHPHCQAAMNCASERGGVGRQGQCSRRVGEPNLLLGVDESVPGLGFCSSRYNVTLDTKR